MLKIDNILQTALTSFARNLGQRNEKCSIPVYFLHSATSDIWCDDKLPIDNSPLTPGQFSSKFPLRFSQWNSFFCFYLNLTAWRVTTVLTFPLRLTPHNLDTITDCSPGPGQILFILLHFWRHFLQAAEAKLAELNHIWQKNSIPHIQTGQDTLNESFVGLVIMMGGPIQLPLTV